jgi:hypothetical protein
MSRCYLLAVAAFVMPLCSMAPAGGALTIGDITSNVQRYERLYENHDVALRYDYTIGDRQPMSFASGRKEIIGSHSHVRYVNQGNLFRVERRGDNVVDNEKLSANMIRTFAGEKTIAYEQDAIANIVQGRHESADRMRPHVLLLRDGLPVPLSTYLSGTEALAAHPRSKLRDGMTVRSEYVGDAEFLGLKCHKVWITASYQEIGDHHRWELWLAEDRNFLPVRMFGWTFNISADLPMSEGEVTGLREVDVDTWFPIEARVTAYDAVALKQDHSQRMQWRAEYSVEDVSLDPHYDAAFFANITFAKGTAVYEVNNGEVTRAYRIGAPDSTGSYGLKKWWLLAVNITVVLAVMCYVVLRRRGHDRVVKGEIVGKGEAELCRSNN